MGRRGWGGGIVSCSSAQSDPQNSEEANKKVSCTTIIGYIILPSKNGITGYAILQSNTAIMDYTVLPSNPVIIGHVILPSNPVIIGYVILPSNPVIIGHVIIGYTIRKLSANRHADVGAQMTVSL